MIARQLRLFQEEGDYNQEDHTGSFGVGGTQEDIHFMIILWTVYFCILIFMDVLYFIILKRGGK